MAGSALADSRRLAHIDLFDLTGFGLRYDYSDSIMLGAFVGSSTLARTGRQTHNDAAGEWNDDHAEGTASFTVQGTARYHLNETLFAESRLGLRFNSYAFKPDNELLDEDHTRRWDIQSDTLLGVQVPLSDSVILEGLAGIRLLVGRETQFTKNDGETDYDRRFNRLSAHTLRAISLSYSF